MAIQTFAKKPNMPNGSATHPSGQVLTPPPTSEQRRSTSYGREAYGCNAFGSASSDAPGKRTTSPLADELEQAGDNGELARVRAQGVSLRHDAVDPWRMRNDESSKPYPITHGMTGARPGPKVPGSIVTDTAPPVRKPGA